jgi:hypothetical protein
MGANSFKFISQSVPELAARQTAAEHAVRPRAGLERQPGRLLASGGTSTIELRSPLAVEIAGKSEGR